MRSIEQIWYSPFSWQSAVLLPLAGLFALIAAGRRGLYRAGIFKSNRLSVPVVVVGNLTAGGAGKTPLTLSLARQLVERGWRPGIISRGYRGSAVDPLEVTQHTDPARCGDEPLLLACAGVPVFVCPDRAAAGRALLTAHPEVDVLLCDDGLQHYRLARDIELCVIDGVRGFGNGLPIPAGPLREPVARLAAVDAVVLNGVGAMVPHEHMFHMTLQPGLFYSLHDAGKTMNASELGGFNLAAVCGIGNPARFFATLRSLGLSFKEYPFPDHHDFSVADLPEADLVMVTEKDAVKLAALPGLGARGDKIRVLPVSARLEPDLTDWLIGKLKHGRQTA
ncbi:MAG: tetraacyldisaccharide 4'-kinase [Formivibrio sp.]|nr:tetraacyldisaccharide 4'-kinase [Formivibrio sp.]